MKKLWKILVPVLTLAVVLACVFAFVSSADDTAVTIPDGTVAEGSGTNVVAIIRGGAEVKQYDTLKAARNDVATTGDTIKVLCDFQLTTSSLNLDLTAKTVTVDMNGKTIYADGTLKGEWSNTFIPSAGAKWSFISSAKDAEGNAVRGRFVYTDTSVAHVFSMTGSDDTTEINVENIDFTIRGTGSVFNGTRGGKVTVKNSSMSVAGSSAYPVSIDHTNDADVIAVFENVDLSSKTPCVNINKSTRSVTVTMNNVRFNTQGRFINVGKTEEECKTSVTLTDCTLVTSGDCGFAIKGGKLAITGTKTRVNMTNQKNFIGDTTQNSDVTLGYGIRFAEGSFNSGTCAQLTAAQSQIVKDGLYGDTYPYVYGATLQVNEHGSTDPVYWDGNLKQTIKASTSNNVADGDNTYCYFDSSKTTITGPYFVWQKKTIDFATYRYAVIEASLTFKTSSPIDAGDGTAGYIYAMWGKSDGNDTGDAWKYSIRFKQSADGTGTTYTYGGKSVTLPFRQWAHINWIIDTAENKAVVYINGELLASVDTAFGETTTRIRELRLGGNKIVQDYDMCFDNLRMVGYADADFANNVFAAEPVFTGSDFLNYSKNVDLPGAKISGTGEYYRTLALAVAAAKANYTITLVEDSTDDVVIDKPLSIDEGGHTLSGVTTHRLISHENAGQVHTFKVTGIKMNLTLYSDFTANLYILAPDGYEGETVTIGGKAYYIMKEEFDAHKLAEKRSVKVEGLDVSVSVLSYAKALFALDDSALMAGEKTLMADALVYANAAAKLIDKAEDAEITALLAANESYKSDLKTITPEEKNIDAVKSGVRVAYLDLESQPIFVFELVKDMKVSVSYTNFWGATVTKTQDDAVDGKIKIDNMRIFDFANEITITVGSNTATYSLANYADSMKDDADTMNLCNALYTYIETAKAFKKANPAPVM